MLPAKISLVLVLSLSVSFAGNLEEKWFKDLKKAQESYRNGETQSSSLNTSEFQTKRFTTKAYGDTQETGMQKKAFTVKQFGSGRSENAWAGKKFNTPGHSGLSGQSSNLRSDQTYATGSSSLGETRVAEDKKAREDGVKAILEREKSVMADMRYQGPEAEKIAEEIKLINETLKNREDLKDHKITIKEIREILNKN